MSVLVIARITVDRSRFEALFENHHDDLLEIAKVAQAAGAIHHQFVAGNGELCIVDEWETAAAFDAFFSSQPKIAEMMAEAGVTNPPAIEVYEVIDSPDQF
jgi:heme-degrading monooxygenase HmoA